MIYKIKMSIRSYEKCTLCKKTFLQSTKSIFCSQLFCTGQHLMQSNFAKSKHFIYKIAFYHFVNSKQNVKACKAYFITSIFFKRKRFFKNALKF